METLRYVVLANALLAIGSTAFYALLRQETFFRLNRLILWLSLIGSLFLPLLELPDWRPQPVRMAMRRTAQAIVPNVLPALLPRQPTVTTTASQHGPYRVLRAQPASFAWSWVLILGIVYGSGVLFLLIRFGIRLISLRRLIQRSIHERYDDFTLVINEDVVSPFSFFGWVVLNPACHSPNELEQILRHERAHVREHHSVDMLSAELTCVVLWFNPAVYLFRHLVHQTLEYSADQAVLAEGVDAKEYQYNLIKVSLTKSRSSLTSNFSKSKVRARIAMLNQPRSAKASWLRYATFCLCPLSMTLASTHAYSVHAVARYVPQPIKKTIDAVATVVQQSTDLVINRSESTTQWKAKVVSVRNPSLAGQVANKIDASVETPRLNDAVPESPSRYIVYENHRLWWIITPKATLDDFVLIKKELAKYGMTLQVTTFKIDPQYSFIDQLDYRLLNGNSGGWTGQEGDGNPGQPIHTTGGYFDVPSWSEPCPLGQNSYVAIYPTAKILPEAIRQVIREDESFVAKLIRPKTAAQRTERMEELVRAGIRKYGHLGIGPRQFRQDEIAKQSSPGSYLVVHPDSSLSVDETADYAKVFINNEPVAPQAIRLWKLTQLYTLAVLYSQRSADGKRPGTPVYLLFYFDETN